MPGRKAIYRLTGALAAGAVATSNWMRGSDAASAVDTGTRKPEAYPYNTLRGHCYMTQASAAGGLVFQWSADGITVMHSLAGVAVLATTDFTFSIPMIQGMYVRSSLTNGVAAILSTDTWELCWFLEDT